MKKIALARITPESSLNLLSQVEVTRLAHPTDSNIHETLRRCALAVLNTGGTSDDTQEILATYHDFDIQVIPQERGIKLEIHNAPASAFVDGEMIKGIKEHLFAVLRDLVYIDNELKENRDIDFNTSSGITNGVFHIVRNAGVLKHNNEANLIVCWGGHSIGEIEYQYTKKVGYELGLRGLDICTGCGPGAMKGPMKGATIAHAKQRRAGRYLGITEPGIIAAESPNPIVNQLVIMPDIEKRLEAFVRTGHGVIVFPGGVGTAEEILYLLGLLLQEGNDGLALPVIFTGPTSAAPYFEQIDQFIRLTLGEEAAKLYEIIIADPERVARSMVQGVRNVRQRRIERKDSFFFNWSLDIPLEFQQPFVPTHEAMAALDLHHGRKPFELAADLRRAFSGIVAGNVKEAGMRRVEEHGPFRIHGDKDMMEALDGLLRAFVAQRRMKISGQYRPCYEVVT